MEPDRTLRPVAIPAGTFKPANIPGVKTAADIEPLLRIIDLTRVLNCSRSVVERMRAAGQLPKPDFFVGTGSRKSPRWRPGTIRAWIDGQARGRDGAR